MIEIKSIAGRVLYTAPEASTLREAVLQAIAAGANLADAYLAGANLADANLADANLAGANLARANLAGANLADAYLARANLARANLADANLADAYLAGANLAGANLARAKGIGDWLATTRKDVWAVLDAAPAEVPGLLAALRAGKVDGTVYEGACACLVGTIANLRGQNYLQLDGIKPDADRPAERWFLRIRKGDTPLTSPDCAIAAAWIEDWMRGEPDAAPAVEEHP